MVVISAGNILNQTFSIGFKNLVSYLILGAIAFVPLGIYMFTAVEELHSQTDLLVFSIVLAGGGFLLANVITGFLAFSVFRTLQDEPIGFGGMMSAGLSRLVPILAAGIAVGFGVMLSALPGALVMFSLDVSLSLLVAVPMAYAIVVLALTVPVAAVEGAGPFTALKRSVELSKGCRGTIFGALVVIRILEFVAEKIRDNMTDSMLTIWIGLATVVIFAILNGIARAVAYHDIRAVKEGVKTADLASVFE